MNTTQKKTIAWVLGVVLGWGVAISANAQTNSIKRTSSFEYDASGLLKSEVIEPEDADACLLSTYEYDEKGNPVVVSSKVCEITQLSKKYPNHALSSAAARNTTKRYDIQTVEIDSVGYSTPAGVFNTQTTNALGHSESYEYDPRHGKVTKLIGPNVGVTTWSYDGFGRKTRESRANGTYTLWTYHLCEPAGAGGPKILDAVCAMPVSNGSIAHAGEWYLKEVSYGSNNVALSGAKYQIYDALGRVVRVRSDSFMAEGYAGNRQPTIEDTIYNALGWPIQKSIPYLKQGGDPQWTYYTYDDIGRVVNESSPDGNGQMANVTTNYNGLETEVINALGYKKTIYRDARGQIERVVDALKTPVLYTYDALGQLTQTVAQSGEQPAANDSVTKLTYDVRGRKTSMQDPAMGRWNYAYNAFGELVWQQDSLSKTVSIAYDLLGRMTSRTESDLVSQWHYDKKADGSACGASVGKLCEARTLNADNTVGYRRLHTYDTKGRPISTSNVLDNAAQPAVTSQVYDSVTGRLIERTWPTGYKAMYDYTTAGANWSAGHLWRVRGMDGSTQNALWQAMDKDPQGRLIRYQGGNGVVTLKDVEQATGRTRSLKGTGNGQVEGNVLNLVYSKWDQLGNLRERSDANTGVSEGFGYDELNRLTTATVTAGALTSTQMVQVLYDGRGNIKYKSDVGYYHYDAQRPNRLTQITTTGSIQVTVQNTGSKHLSYAFDDDLPGVRSVDLGQGAVTTGNGNLMYTVSLDDVSGAHTIRWEAYTSFNKIRQMRFGSLSNPNDPTNAVADRTVDLVYGPEHQRLRQTVQLTSNAPSHMEAGTTWYMNGRDSLGLSYEKEVKANGLIEHKHYLSAGGEVFAQYSKREGNLNGKPAQQVSYFHQDHLGSLAVITNEAGQVIERLAYDPWGKRRFTDGNRDNDDTLTSSNTKRGYTMHEHMDEMGVINMNGRVDDPMIGRFLTADPYVQSPFFLQSFNRYAYVLNNPLTLSDPSGYYFSSDGTEHPGPTDTGGLSPIGIGSAERPDVVHVTVGSEDSSGGSQGSGPITGGGSGGNTGNGPGGRPTVVSGVAVAPNPACKSTVCTDKPPATRPTITVELPPQKPQYADEPVQVAVVVNPVTIGIGVLAVGVTVESLPDAIEATKKAISALQNALSVNKSDDTDEGDDSVGEEDRPTRVTNPKHHPNSVSPEPADVDRLYEGSVKDKEGKRWAKDENGELHRFSKPSNGETHWNGTTDPNTVDPIRSQNVPNEIKREFGYKK